MKSFLTQLACFALALAFAKGTVITEKQEPTNILRYPHYQRAKHVIECGGVLTNHSQQIIYKPFEQVENNERCVWILAAPNASQYRVRVSAFGFEPEAGLLNIAELKLAPQELTNGPLQTASSVNYTANALMITFHSPSDATGITGFALEYEVLAQSGRISPHSSHQIVGPDAVNIKFPDGRDEYDNSELASFVFPPLDNANIGFSARLLIYKLLGFEGNSCVDSVTVFRFDPVTKLYTIGGSLCGDVINEIITLNDLAVLVFRSDSSNHGKGFTLGVANCGILEEKPVKQ